MDLAPVWQAVSTISGDIASTPLNFFKSLEDNAKEIELSNRINFIVSEEANPITSAVEFWRRLMIHALLWGNGYGFIDRAQRDKSAKPRNLINLHPEFVTPMMSEDSSAEIMYHVRTEKDGRPDEKFLHDFEVIHIKGPSVSIGEGVDWLQKARDVLGLGLSIQKHNSKFFANGMQLGGVLMVPPTFTQDAKDNLEQGWQDRLANPDNAFKIAILRDGAKYIPIVAKPKEAQLKESKEENVRDIARFFNLPGAKLNLVDSVSYNSTEQLQLIYLTTTLRHWFATIQGECNLKLRTQPQKDRKTHFFDHDVSELLKTDAITKEEILSLRRSNMIITANEWRAAINMPKSNDPDADKLLNPNTSVETDEELEEDDNEETVDPAVPDEDATSKIRPLVQNTLYRAGWKFTSKLSKTAKKPHKLQEYLDAKSWHKDREDFQEEIGIAFDAIGLTNLTTPTADTFCDFYINQFAINPDNISDLKTYISALTNDLFCGKMGDLHGKDKDDE